MTQNTEASELIPLAPHLFEILLCLNGAPMHGYRIIRDIRERSGGRIQLSTSTLYGGMRRLLRDSLVQEAGERGAEPSGGPPRRYYRITARGREVARMEAERLQHVARFAAESLLQTPAAVD